MSRGDLLPCLPLLIWKTPPGLEMILAQDGVPFVRVHKPNPADMAAGRFLIVDRRKLSEAEVGWISTRHVVIDVRDIGPVDWKGLIDHRASPMEWNVAGAKLIERVARTDRFEIRSRILDKLRSIIAEKGGLWARVAPYPAPYRSAFNLRVDLDEQVEEDYLAFAKAREPIDECTTHFVGTRAYGASSRVLADLLSLDTQSHGHHHHIYREPEANLANLERAERILRDRGFRVSGFAAPHGRWNPGLDLVLEELGYLYSSDFSIGRDDYPFFPWREDRFSEVLQVPIHPVCEGLFLDAGLGPEAIAGYFRDVIRAKLAKGEPAFVYGHPERRLGRFPEVVRAVAAAVDEHSFVWRVTLTDFARWWRERAKIRLSVSERGGGRFDLLLDHVPRTGLPVLEIVRGRHSAKLPLSTPHQTFKLDAFAYEKLDETPAVPPPRFARTRRGLKGLVRETLDWETVTPIEDLPVSTFLGRIKKELRRRRDQVA